MAPLSAWWLTLKRYFWMSDTLSMTRPIAKSITPAMSPPVPKGGWGKRVILGEFRTVTGNETVQTQTIWKIQKPRNLKKLSRLSSKRSSLPVLMIRKSRKAESRAPHAMMKSETTIWRAWWYPLKASVMMVRTTKFVPPAKSREVGQTSGYD